MVETKWCRKLKEKKKEKETKEEMTMDSLKKKTALVSQATKQTAEAQNNSKHKTQTEHQNH